MAYQVKPLLASCRSAGLTPGCSSSDLPPRNTTGKAIEDDSSTWDLVLTVETGWNSWLLVFGLGHNSIGWNELEC